MDLSPTAEQKELVDWARPLVAEKFPLERLAESPRTGDVAALDELAELGWFGLAVPEPAGGSGLTIVEDVMLMHASGRHLPSPSLVATMVAVHVSGAPVTELIGRSKRVALATPVADARQKDEFFLLDGDGADFAVLIDQRGVRAITLAELTKSGGEAPCLDDSLAMTRWRMPANLVASDSASAEWLRAQLLLSASLVGAGEAALEMAVEYAKVREQFGRPIGSFQAIKHKCADMALQLGSARSQLMFAAVSLNEGAADAEFQVRAARLLSSRAATSASYGNVQIHGGIGFHAECNAQRFVKRVAVLNMVGSAALHDRGALLAGPAGDTADLAA